MPENAAAEGGYGLGVSEAFGGQVGTGSVSPSAVGGTQGGLGNIGGEGPAAQSGRYGMGTPNAAANAAMAQSIADRAAAIAQSNLAVRGIASKAASTLGIGNVAQAQGLVANTVDAFGTISPRGIAAIAAETGVPASAVAAMANTAISGQMAPAAASSIADNMSTANQFANQSAQYGLMSAAINTGLFGLPSVPSQSTNTSIGRSAPALGGITSVVNRSAPALGNITSVQDTAPNSVNAQTGTTPSLGIDRGLAQAAAQGLVNSSINASGTMSQDAVNSVANQFGLSPSEVQGMVNNAVSGLNAPTSTNPSVATTGRGTGTNVTPGQIAQDISRSTTTPNTQSNIGWLGRLGMGLTLNPFASRESQTQSLLDRGYTQADVDNYFSITDANIAATNAATENAIGARDELPVKKTVEENAAEPLTLTEMAEQGPRVNSPAQQYRQAMLSRFAAPTQYGTSYGQYGPMQQPTQPTGKSFGSGAQQGMSQGMMNSALDVYEAQRGAGTVPYQMAQYGLGSLQPQMQPGQYVSPAFQYAAQNYGRLGGAQRLMARPMPMLSVAERQTVNDMQRAMDEQRAREQRALNDFTSMAGMFSNGFSGKGAGSNNVQNVRSDLAPLLSAFSKFG